jgi:hypothetical protein
MNGHCNVPGAEGVDAKTASLSTSTREPAAGCEAKPAGENGKKDTPIGDAMNDGHSHANSHAPDCPSHARAQDSAPHTAKLDGDGKPRHVSMLVFSPLVPLCTSSRRTWLYVAHRFVLLFSVSGWASV